MCKVNFFDDLPIGSLNRVPVIEIHGIFTKQPESSPI